MGLTTSTLLHFSPDRDGETVATSRSDTFSGGAMHSFSPDRDGEAVATIVTKDTRAAKKAFQSRPGWRGRRD